MVARVVASGRIADRLAPVSFAAARTAPCAAIEQPPDPAEGMEAEVAMAAEGIVAALVATAAATATAARAAPLAAISTTAAAGGPAGRPASRFAVSRAFAAGRTPVTVFAAGPDPARTMDRPASCSAVAVAFAAAIAAAPSSAISIAQESTASRGRQ